MNALETCINQIKDTKERRNQILAQMKNEAYGREELQYLLGIAAGYSDMILNLTILKDAIDCETTSIK